jgi:hypothetical protein
MIKLRPISGEQTFSIIPSSYNLNGTKLSLTENGTNMSQSDVSFTWELSDNGNFVEITLTEPAICNVYRVENPTDGLLFIAYLDCEGWYYSAGIAANRITTVKAVSEIVVNSTAPELIITLVSETTQEAVNLKEDGIYTLEFKRNNDPVYRDVVYATSKVNKNEVFSYSQGYTTYNSGDDEYIVL